VATSAFNWLWIALIACLLLLAYTYAGYPLIVMVLRRLFAREHRRDPDVAPRHVVEGEVQAYRCPLLVAPSAHHGPEVAGLAGVEAG